MGTGSEQLEDTPLHEAVRFCDLDEVLKALRAGHDPNQIGLYQWSPLHEAAHAGEEAAVRLLLKHGGDPNRPDLLRACTALHYASSGGHAEVLQLLLQAGGDWQVQDADGQTSLDVATGDCLPVLRKLSDCQGALRAGETSSSQGAGDEKLLVEGCSRKSLEQMVLEETKQDLRQPLEAAPGRGSGVAGSSDRGSTCDPEEVSIDSIDSLEPSVSLTSSGVPQAWKTDGPVLGVNRKMVLGHIQLSFEYNSKKSTFKIRVWQVSDLLMPPVETSMISSIYVKSYLLPDKKKETKRKTEEVRVYSKPEDKSTKGGGAPESIFKPCTFHFSKAPEYKKVSEEMVRERMVHLEVCIVQKYSMRSFLLATWNMPLKEAVKRLVKESHPLTPRMSTELPENMKVYDGSSLSVTSTRGGGGRRPFSSFPNSRAPSTSSLHRLRACGDGGGGERAQSDTDLHSIRVEEGVRKAASIEISLPDDDDDREERELEHALQRICVLRREEEEEQQWTSIPMTITDREEEEVEQTKGRRLVIAECDIHQVAVHVPKADHTTTPHTFVNRAFDWKVDQSEEGETNTDETINNNKPEGRRKHSAGRFSLGNKLRERSNSSGRKKEKAKKELASSNTARVSGPRAESPTWQWDNYMEPLQTALEPVDLESDGFGIDLDMPVLLPMTTSLDMPRVHGNSFTSRSYDELEAQAASPSLRQVARGQRLQAAGSYSPSRSPDQSAVQIPEEVELHFEDDDVVVGSRVRRGRGKQVSRSPSPSSNTPLSPTKPSSSSSNSLRAESLLSPDESSGIQLRAMSAPRSQQIRTNPARTPARNPAINIVPPDDDPQDEMETILI